MGFKPSTYQQDILDFFLNNPQSNMLVNALAGSGKSTTACMLSEHSKTSDLYIAFNASVVEEFKKKIKNPKTKVMTMHSLAYSIMLYNVEQESKDSGEKPKGFGSQRSKRTVNLDNFKPHKILDEEITKRYGRYIEFAKRVFLKDNYVNLYNLCRLTLTDMSSNKDVSRLIDDHVLFLYYGDEGYSAPDISEITSTLKILDTKSRQQFETQGIIDFTDMLWITFNKLKYDNWEVPYWALYTNIYCDEVQDFSNIQLNFLKFIKRAKGRYVFIGDFHQAIYNFAGANAQAFNQIPKMFAPVETFDLPVCYRCAKSHLSRVNREYGIPILPRDDAPMGFVKTIDKNKISEYAKAGDMVISRKNKWIAEVVLDLARNGTPIFIEDKDMVGAIKRQILSSKCTSVGTLEKFLQKVISNYNKKLFEIVSKNVREGGHEEERLEAVAETNSKIDNTSFLLEILEGYLENHASSDSVSKFSNFIDKLLNTTPSPNCVRLCSIHKAKGLEATNVFVLNEAKINYDFRNSKEQNIQEKNLSYIATTRAKEGLYLVKEPSKTVTTRNTDCYLLPDNDVLKKREQDFKKAIVRETMGCF
jgi:superfamily I DNA/RNA helicase|uniref:Helicase n=1 Tax=Bacteriophage sp. TaxID=38018 RepID=A0A8D9PEB0_9VIRU|nr:MAG TPA: helicase [Bacteriophage sp.]